MKRLNGTHSVIAVLLLVLALGAMVKAVAGRPVTTAAEAPRASRWQVVLQVGHQARARGDVPSARRAYLTALFRARGERSLVGVLGAAEGLEALGDREVVERALAMAAALGPHDEVASAPTRLQALRDRLTATGALPGAAHVGR
jgi:hypothetical protein